MLLEEETTKKLFKIGLTLKEKTKKKTKANSEHCIRTETTIEQRKISRETQKVTTTKPTTISKQPSTHLGLESSPTKLCMHAHAAHSS
jgi:hypothetical protein